jgi:hypothetical protein
MDLDGVVLPPLRWQRGQSRFRHRWVIRDGATIVAIVAEIGDVRSWIFYWYRIDTWVELIEFGSQDPPVGGIHPRFGEIVEYAGALNPSHACVMVRESDNGTLWWLLYYRVRVSVYLLMCAFQSRWIDVEVDRMIPGIEESSDEDDASEFVQLVFDI